jgi:cysteine desulfurase
MSIGNRIYMDHSATTPVDESVAAAMTEFMLDKFGNPSSIHSFGRDARQGLDEAREAVAALMGAAAGEIYFTSGGTEADNIALLGGAESLKQLGNHILISNIEHPAVHGAGNELIKRGFDVGWIPADRYGEVHVETIEKMLTDRTVMVSVMHVNNEIGTINDIGAIGSLCRSRGIVFHTDAVQSYGKVPLNVKDMNVDLASVSSHKIYGPKGVGALYIRKGIEVKPRGYGGHQEDGIRPGTENLPGIIGFGRAAEICSAQMTDEAKVLSGLRDELYMYLTDNLDHITLNGHPVRRLPGNLNISFHGVEGEALLVALDLEGIAVSTGSACSSGSTSPSKVLLNIGLTPEEAQSSLRLTLGRSNTQRDIEYTGRVIVDAVNRLRALATSDVKGR